MIRLNLPPEEECFAIAKAMTGGEQSRSSSLLALSPTNRSELQNLDALAPERRIEAPSTFYFTDKVDDIRKVNKWSDYTIKFTASPAERQIVYNDLWNASREVPAMETFPLGAPERSLDWYAKQYDAIYKKHVPQSWSPEEKAFALFKLSLFWSAQNIWENGGLYGKLEDVGPHRNFGDMTRHPSPNGVCGAFNFSATELCNAIIQRNTDLHRFKARDRLAYLREFNKSVNSAALHMIAILENPAGETISFGDAWVGRRIIAKPGVQSGPNGISWGANHEPSWGGAMGTFDGFTQEAFLARAYLPEKKYEGARNVSTTSQVGAPAGTLTYEQLRTPEVFNQMKAVENAWFHTYWKHEAEFKGRVGEFQAKLGLQTNNREPRDSFRVTSAATGLTAVVSLNTSWNGR